MPNTWAPTSVPGVLLGRSFEALDQRGVFVKTWRQGTGPIPLVPDEIFFSTSSRGVFRGMHVQWGTAAGYRLVFVTAGLARDFVVDLRVGSPQYGRVIETDLEPGGWSVLIPPGCAHGFESVSDETTMVYVQQGAHDPGLDIGVHWRSCGISLTTSLPIISGRDDSLPRLEDFASPFVLEKQGG